jgi:bromodomain-containing factor 1
MQESKFSESAPKPNGDLPADTKVTTNDDGFSANEALPDEAKEDGQSAGEKGDADHDISNGMDKVNMDDTAAPADTEMPDAPADRAPEETTSEGLSPKSHPKPEPEAHLEDQGKDEKEPTADAAGPTASSLVLGTKEDVAMADTEEQAETPAAMDHTAESTQETVVTDDTPVSPKGGTAKPPADAHNGPVDVTAGTPPPPTPADTSMSEAAQPSAKVSRERDIDSEDEPVAKRTKVGHAAEEVQVQTGTPQDRMEVDQQAGADKASPYLAGGEPKKLDDDSLNDSPITEWQNKQIRQVLAGVKKTKVGMSFRLPVQQLWPGLWADYSAKVSNPVDISTMEKRLRGDAPRYATMGEFKKDLDLMVQNAVTFNGEGHDVTLQAKACRDAILARMALQTAVEPPKPERKESAKAHTTRHVEPRATAPPLNTAAATARPSKGAAASPSQKPAVPESPAFALPPGSNGVPLIRRDSTKPDSRAKRPVKPAHPKDLVYDTKRKKKLPLELRFCDEVLTELRKTKHYDINAAFMQPVDPVALNIPSYHKIIKKPMDLQTMLTKLNGGEYTSAKEFEKDFDLIIKNCRTFNGEDHIVYAQALRLQDLYRAEMSKKDEWMAKHAPVSTAAASHAAGNLRDDSDSEEADSEADPEQDEERKRTENRMATLQKRIDQEQKKVNDMVTSGTADIADVEIAQSVVAMLQKQFMTERAKLAALPAKKAGKPKPAKSKKAGGASALPAKKATAGVGGAAAKKAGPKKSAKKKIGPMEKEIIIDSLGNLDGEFLERAIDLIKKDTGQDENDAGELELDIEILSEEVLVKLYEIALKANPNALAEKQRQHGLPAAPSSDPPAPSRPKQPSKSKKNKPMSKSEQERRIQQLNELRAQAVRQASGSQEPMESIEGNGTEPTVQAEHESEDEVDSEED